MQRLKLSLVVFVSGAVVMAFEIVGSRVLAPYYGTSVIVWTALIGVILGALSLGYWLGGRLADKKPEERMLAAILLAAGLSIALMAVSKDVFLIFFSSAVPNLYLGTLTSTVVLFLAPSVFLGMVTPYAVRLALKQVETSGSTVGNLYALSTLGSIVGTFAAGFLLLPIAGHAALLGGVATIEALLALILIRKPKTILFVIAVVMISFAATQATAGKLLGNVDVDTRYARVTISDESPAPDIFIRRMRINDENSSAAYLGLDDLAYRYTRFYRLVDVYVPEAAKTLLVGGAGYSYPKDFLSKHIDSTMDVVEIDPGVTKLAREYFDLSEDDFIGDDGKPRMTIYHEDGRRFLDRNNQKYDAIFMDAYRGGAVPYHLASREAIELLADAVADGGAVFINVISSIEGSSAKFLHSLLATLDTEFSSIDIYPVPESYSPDKTSNIMLVAHNGVEGELISENSELESFLDNLWPKSVHRGDILTDDKNPADFYLIPVIAGLKGY